MVFVKNNLTDSYNPSKNVSYYIIIAFPINLISVRQFTLKQTFRLLDRWSINCLQWKERYICNGFPFRGYFECQYLYLIVNILKFNMFTQAYVTISKHLHSTLYHSNKYYNTYHFHLDFIGIPKQVIVVATIHMAASQNPDTYLTDLQRNHFCEPLLQIINLLNR